MVHMWKESLRNIHGTFGRCLTPRISFSKTTTSLISNLSKTRFFQNRAVFLFWSQLSRLNSELSMVYGVGKYIYRDKIHRRKCFEIWQTTSSKLSLKLLPLQIIPAEQRNRTAILKRMVRLLHKNQNTHFIPLERYGCLVSSAANGTRFRYRSDKL